MKNENMRNEFINPVRKLLVNFREQEKGKKMRYEKLESSLLL